MRLQGQRLKHWKCQWSTWRKVSLHSDPHTTRKLRFTHVMPVSKKVVQSSHLSAGSHKIQVLSREQRGRQEHILDGMPPWLLNLLGLWPIEIYKRSKVPINEFDTTTFSSESLQMLLQFSMHDYFQLCMVHIEVVWVQLSFASCQHLNNLQYYV